MEDTTRNTLEEIEMKIKKEIGSKRSELGTARDFNQRLNLTGSVNGLTDALKILRTYTAPEEE